MPSYWPNIQAGGWGAAIGGGLTAGVNAVKGMTDIESDVQQQAIRKDVADRVKKEYEEGQMPIPKDKTLGMFAPQYHKPIEEMMRTEGIIEKMGDKEVVRKVHFKDFIQSLEKSDIKKALMVKAGQNQVREANKMFQEEYDKINPQVEAWEKSWAAKLQKTVDPETGVVDMAAQAALKKKMAEDDDYNMLKQSRDEAVKHLQATEIAEREEQKRMNILDIKHQERIAKGMSREDIADVEWGRKSEEEVLMKIKRREAQLTAEALINKTIATETIKAGVKKQFEKTPEQKAEEAGLIADKKGEAGAKWRRPLKSEKETPPKLDDSEKKELQVIKERLTKINAQLDDQLMLGVDPNAPNTRGRAKAELLTLKGQLEGQLKGFSTKGKTPAKGSTPESTAKVPPNATKGTYKGVRAWTLDEKTFFDMNGKRLN